MSHFIINARSDVNILEKNSRKISDTHHILLKGTLYMYSRGKCHLQGILVYDIMVIRKFCTKNKHSVKLDFPILVFVNIRLMDFSVCFHLISPNLLSFTFSLPVLIYFDDTKHIGFLIIHPVAVAENLKSNYRYYWATKSTSSTVCQ